MTGREWLRNRLGMMELRNSGKMVNRQQITEPRKPTVIESIYLPNTTELAKATAQ